MTVRSLEGSTADVQADVERLLDALDASVGTIAAEMVGAITSEIPAYDRPRREALVEDVREHCTHHATLMIRCTREDREPRRDELVFARRASARRVRQGVPLQALLQAFRLGHRTVWDAIVLRAPDTPAGSRAALSLARPAMQYIDIVSTYVAESYLKEEQRLLATADRERRDLLENLLAGRLPADGHAGLERQSELVVGVARVSAPGPADPNDLHRAADVLTAQTADPGADALVVVRQGEIVAVIAAETASADALARLRAAQALLAERRAIPLRVGVSARFSGLAGVAQAYTEARQALLRTSDGRPLLALEELSTFDYLVATADRAAWHVARRTSAALLEADSRNDGALTDTIIAYVDCDLDAGRAGRRLGVHPNTVRYRLRRISALTGRDPGRFHDLVELATVIRMARAQPNAPA